MNDVVTKPLLYIHETRRRSDGHVDGVTVASRRVDAIDASLKFGKVQKQTLSQHGMNAVVRCSASTKQRYTALTRGDSDDADSKS